MTAPGANAPSAELLATIYDNMSDGVVAFDAEGRILFCNQAMGLLAGVPVEALVGKFPDEAWASKGPGQGRRLSSSTVQQVIQRPDGSQRVVTAKSFTLEGNSNIEVAIYRDVTRILNAKRAQERSESLFNAFMENSPAVASIKDEQGRYAFVNSELVKIFGKNTGDWIGKTDFDMWPADTARLIHENDQEVLRSGSARHSLENLPHGNSPHGEDVHHWLSLRFLLDLPAEGRFISTMSIDITQQREAENEVQHRLALEASIAGISAILSAGEDERLGEALGLVGEALGVDRVALYEARDSGLSLFVLSDAWMGPRASSLVVENELSLINMPWWGARLRDDALFAISNIRTLPEEARGEKEWFIRSDIHSFVVIPISSIEGTIYGFIRFDSIGRSKQWPPSDLRLLEMLGQMFSGHMERMQREAELLRANHELQRRLRDRATEATEKRQYFDELRLMRSVVVNANDCVIVTEAGPILNPGPRIVYVNQAFTKTMGYTAEEAVGRSPRFLQGPETERETLAKIRRALQRWDSLTTEILNYRKSGEPIWIELSIFPVADETGSYTHWVGIQRDISLRKREEQERARLMERVEQERRMESLEILAGGIAHEFNNLLVGIMGNSSLAHEEVGEESSASRYISQVEKAATRAAELTRQMLSFSGQDNAAMTTLDLSASVRDLVAFVERQAFDRQIRLTTQLDTSLPAIRGDFGQVRQLIVNLLNNAFEAVRPGGAVEVSTELRVVGADELMEVIPQSGLSPGEYVVLSVRDNGVGISPDTMLRIFEPFFTTKFPGRGLGLSAVLGIVRGHGSGVRVSSVRGEGTTLDVYFHPLLEGAGRVEEGPIEDPNWRGEGLILVVDDDGFVRNVARSILERTGFEVITANDGQEGLEVFEAQGDRIHAMIVDIKMPRMNGDVLLTKLRDRGSRVPVVLSSGYSDVDVGSEKILDEWSVFLAKPYRPGTLLSALRRLMGR